MKQKKPSVGSVKSKEDLLTLQRSFAKAIRRPLNSNDKMRFYDQSSEMIAPTQNLRPHDRLELYAQQYWWRIEQSFDEDFTTVQLIMSVKQYEALRDAYLMKFPSRSFTLRNLGDRFPEFIKKNPVLAKPSMQLVLDCALFDWARVEAFDAAQMKPLRLTDIKKPFFIKEKIKLQPHVQILTLHYPVDTLLKEGKQRLFEEASNTTLQYSKKKKGPAAKKLKTEKVYLAVHRHEERVLMKRLTSNQSRLLKEIAAGTSLQTLANTYVVSHKVSGEELRNAFQEWASLEWIYLESNNKGSRR